MLGLLQDFVRLEVDLFVSNDRQLLDFLVGFLLVVHGPQFVPVENLLKRTLHFDKYQLILGHHVDSLGLHDCMLVLFPHSLFLSALSVQLFLEIGRIFDQFLPLFSHLVQVR